MCLECLYDQQHVHTFHMSVLRNIGPKGFQRTLTLALEYVLMTGWQTWPNAAHHCSEDAMEELPERCWVEGSMCQCASADGRGACRGLSHSGCSAYVPTTKAHRSISAAPAAAQQTIHINNPRPSGRNSLTNSDAVTARVTKRHSRSPIRAQGARHGGHRPDHTEAKNSADNPVMSIAAQVSHSNRRSGNIYVDHLSAVQGCSVKKISRKLWLSAWPCATIASEV